MKPKPSTRSYYAEWKATPGLTWFDLVHGYVYFRWPYFYIANAVGRRPFARFMQALYAVVKRLVPHRARPAGMGGGANHASGTIADGYHGKVLPLPGARKLVTLKHDLTARNLEHVLPYPAAKDIVLKHPDHLAVLQCPCRSARENPCRPLDVCLIVGEPFASFVLEHNPTTSRRIDATAAVAILEAEDERGHVHHAFFKDGALGRFYAICNCCRCCCGAMQAHRQGTPMLASSGYVAEVDRLRCAVCGTCAKYCQFDAIGIVEGSKVIDAVRCLGCGVCVPKCQRGAIHLRRDPARGEPLEIERLVTAVSS
jgi:Pyruvate/2-oxoacid:ferredoxin oxidoreductase delta subunit